MLGWKGCSVEIPIKTIMALWGVPGCVPRPKKAPKCALYETALAQARAQQRSAYVLCTSGSTGAPLAVCGSLAGQRGPPHPCSASREEALSRLILIGMLKQ